MIKAVCLILGTLVITVAQSLFADVGGFNRNSVDPFDSLRTAPVVIKVSVIEKTKGTFVPGLKPEDFVVFEDGERQKATRFQSKEPPLALLVLVDSSGSMRPVIL